MDYQLLMAVLISIALLLLLILQLRVIYMLHAMLQLLKICPMGLLLKFLAYQL